MLPYLKVWDQAMRIGINQKNLQNTTLLLWDTFDNIWKLSGEQEFDVFYPVKRSSLAIAYLTTEIILLRTPENIEQHWVSLESQIIRMCQAGKTAANLYEFSKFFLNTNYRILQSFYPEPTVHENPILK